MFRILVAEDDASARLLMCEVLRRAGYEPCPARDGVEALEVMEHYQCDLAVVDITMPRMDGITFTQTLREGNCDLPVLMVTARVTQEDKRRGFRAGTDDYMVKPFDTKEVVARIKAVLRRCTVTTSQTESSEGVIEFDNLRLDMNSYELRVKGKVVEAPPKELELLNCLASHPNRVYTRDQLLDEVWGFEYYGDSRTIDVHVKRLREKLAGASDKWELKTVWGVGYKFEVRQ